MECWHDSVNIACWCCVYVNRCPAPSNHSSAHCCCASVSGTCQSSANRCALLAALVKHIRHILVGVCRISAKNILLSTVLELFENIDSHTVIDFINLLTCR